MRRSFAALLTAGALLVTPGCGSDTSPASDVPALVTSLDAVDDAVASGDDAAVRDAVDELTDTTTRAREDGDLETAEADRILSAAEALLAALDEPEPPAEEPTPEAPTSSAPPADEDEDAGEEEDEDEGDVVEEQGKPEKGEGKPGKAKGKSKGKG